MVQIRFPPAASRTNSQRVLAPAYKCSFRFDQELHSYKAGGRCAGLVALLLLCTQGLSEEGRHGDIDRSGFECGKVREGARA